MSNFEELDLTILKGLVSDKEKALSFVHENPDGKLFSPDVWNFANLTLSYIRTYKDVPTLQAICLKLKGKESAVESIKNIWNKLESTEYLSQEFAFNVDRMRERYQAREILSLKERLEDASGENAVGEIQRSLQNIKSIKNNNSSLLESKNAKDFIPRFIEDYKHKKDNPDADVGIKTGYTFLDNSISLRDSDYCIFAGESGHGKSLLLNNVACQIWMQKNTIDTVNFTEGKNIMYFSLEMPYADCFARLIARMSGVPISNIENATLSKEEFSKVKKSLDFVKNYPYEFHIVDIMDASAKDLEQILDESGKKYDCIFVDYIGIMKSSDGKEESDWLKQGTISYELRQMARKYKNVMFSAVQLNRKTESKNPSENVNLSRLARSATIATHASLVIMIEARPDENRYSDMSLHILKNRRGPKSSGKLLKELKSGSLLNIEIEDEVLGEVSDDQFADLEDISDKMEILDF